MSNYRKVSVPTYADYEHIVCSACRLQFILTAVFVYDDWDEIKSYQFLPQASARYCPYCGKKDSATSIIEDESD